MHGGGRGQRIGDQTWTGAAVPSAAPSHADLFKPTPAVTLSRNSSQNTSTVINPANATTMATGGALLSTASLSVISFLLHLSVKRLRPRNIYTSPSSKDNPVLSRQPVTREKQVFIESANSIPYCVDTENTEDPKSDWFEEYVKSLLSK
ncbi:unnamed protein product [Gulo gulo]|uniref:Uncharacterized protein n=1 Tax=Gulo gulo TaxID=48420 RepID=A0A9X9LUP1_GULGU|nr:unnamed protein product [Gulo gulo]